MPIPEDWERFKFYARKIRTITHTRNVLEMYLIKMCVGRPTGVLFPNLRALHWLGTNWRNIDFIDMFLSPSLVDLHIRLPRQDQAGRFLNRLSDQNLDLQRLRIRTTPFDITDNEVTRLTFLISSYANLRVLGLESSCRSYTIDVDALWTLARLPSLEALSVMLSEEYIDHPALGLFADIPSPFPTLHTLALTWDDSDFTEVIAELIKSVTSTSLYRVEVYMRYEVDSTEVSTVTQAIAHQRTVQDVKIIHRVFQDDNDSDWDIPLLEDELHDLFDLPYMKKLRVEGFSIFFGESSFIERVIACWPLITEIKFVYIKDVPEREDAVNVVSFADLPVHCPHLRTLYIPWKSDLEHPGDITHLLQAGFEHPISLQYGWLHIPNNMVTAVFLFTVFRNITLVERHGTYLMTLREALATVRQIFESTGRIEWERLDYMSWLEEESLWNETA